ncbi:MAG: TonB-dependent receptor plug domain-containing protein [Flavobacteriales bacterium]|nr:TonB-dependent receptor plug domain-containing protein [Flavobacteriales bacterium]
MKTMIKKLLLLLVFLPCSMMAQTMSGVVSDAMGPLPGVNIVVQGTSNGTATDFDGNYSLSNLKNGDVVVFSFMGFKDFKVTYAGQAKQNVTMAEDAQALDEVVVVGYGSVKKEDLTGSVSLVTAKDFNKGAINTVDGLLNGRTPGVNVTSSGTPGNGATIRIRGQSSLLGNNDPLIVVDGLPITGGLSSVNPNDIASFSILKDASATAIYGNRGANGVILITTKKGSSESLKVSVNMFTTYNTLARIMYMIQMNEDHDSVRSS